MQDSPVPVYSRPAVNRRVLLISRPKDVPLAENFALDQVAVPVPGTGQFVVRNIYLSVDPAQRGWASAAANYSQPVMPGEPMRALAVGVVVASRHDDFSIGEFLYGWFDWQDYCLADPRKILRRVDTSQATLSAHAGLLGINGLTAYLALMNVGRPRPGNTVLVSTAAGAVGSIVGQIARNLGCRIIGLTGSDAKVIRCRERFGYDAAFNYRTTDLGAALSAVAPDGIDVFFDNAGGTILDQSLRHMAIAGRVVQCGTVSVPQWIPAPTGLRNEREVLIRRLQWGGFVIFDCIADFDSAACTLADWFAQGRLVHDEDISSGIERAPGALAELYSGENQGKKLIFIA